MTNIKSFFDKNGYYLAKGIYNSSLLGRMQDDFDRVTQQLLASKENINARWGSQLTRDLESDDSVVFHTHNIHSYSSIWLHALLNPEFLDVVEEILGPDIILHHTKLFQKPPSKGAAFPIHQDWQYFPTIQDTMIAGIIHLTEATDHMGCIRVYPGSHQLGRQSGMMGSGENSTLTKQYPLEKSTIIEAEAGDVIFFHYFTLHGSMPNRSNQTRKTVLVQLHSGKDKVEDGNSHTNSRLVLRGWNHRANRTSASKI